MPVDNRYAGLIRDDIIDRLRPVLNTGGYWQIGDLARIHESLIDAWVPGGFELVPSASS